MCIKSAERRGKWGWVPVRRRELCSAPLIMHRSCLNTLAQMCYHHHGDKVTEFP